jgi:hypothetical protein
MSEIYPLFDVFFEVVDAKKLWIPIGSTFCKGSITIKHKDVSLSKDIYELFLFIDERETIEEISSLYRRTICKWCGVNPAELLYIIDKEWEQYIQSEGV